MLSRTNIDPNKRLTALIIPFYNELKRFDFEALIELSINSQDFLDIYLVDDGSEDGLPELIQEMILELKFPNVFLLSAENNLGKANAIRFGFKGIPNLLSTYNFIGFTDADFSSPPSEILRLANFKNENDYEFVFGTRISTKENLIRTTKFRFIQGKMFTILVSFILGGKFLDSQCGLKYIRLSEATVKMFQEEFLNDWLIDLEMLCRIQKLKKVEVIEVVLQEWTHKEQSKTGFFDLPSVLGSLIKLRIKYGKLSDVRVKTHH